MCEHNGGAITEPEKLISLPGFESIETCGVLEGLLPFLPTNTAECSLLQSVGTICGCLPAPTACELCPNGSNVTNPDLDMPFLAFLFGGIVPTCELAQAYVKSFEATDGFCLVGHALLAGYCGCPGVPFDDEAPSCTTCRGGEDVDRNQTLDIPGFPFETCGQLDDAVDFVIKDGSYECELVQKVSTICGCPSIDNPCHFCKDGSNITLPDKEAHFARDILFGIVPTCDFVEIYTASHEEGSEFCDLAQQTSSFCGCPKKENHCVYCPDGGFAEEQYRDDSRIIRLDDDLRLEPTCELIEASQYQYGKDEGVCILGKIASFLCGCNGGEFRYMGADTDAQKQAIVWVSRFFSLISLIGSSLIWYDILSNKRKRKQVYNRLIFMMSIFDATTSIGLLIGAAAQPEESAQGTFVNYLGSEGTKATCKVQGFLIELGITSVFYNLLLSIYYKLTIVDGWREERLKRSQKWFHGIPLLFGFGLAFAGLPFYDVTPFGCFLYPIPVKETLAYMIPLAYFPVIFSVLFLISMMAYIYSKVMAQDKRADKWRIDTKFKRGSILQTMDGARLTTKARLSQWYKKTFKRTKKKKSKLVSQVYWQAVAYVMSFLVTWPIVCLALANADSIATSHYGFWMVFSIVMPLQGFNNSWVYFRPRLSHRWELRQKRLRKEKKRERERMKSGRTSCTEINVGDASRMHLASQSSDRMAVSVMRHEDPSAYLAIAGLSCTSSNSEKSMDENNVSQRIQEHDPVEIEFETGRKPGTTVDEMGLSFLGGSTFSLGMPVDDTQKYPLEESLYNVDAGDDRIHVSSCSISSDDGMTGPSASTTIPSSSITRATELGLDKPPSTRQRVTFAAQQEEEEEAKEEEA
eukprot:CAMPEP_0119011870 /NCGR_PEP_ID=MMETSP1176-20130426/5938_1 /TAXON_ID=265551 /ORGANISM="Synedropsis recta cf, Strain CCMP1620" /LENGTH=862 /DNA_ID=CAMNT_0006964745 /DNA_START=103 /DNA_END=2691 /DNA_ORIENTATION=+